MDDAEPTYLEKLENTILTYRRRAAHSRIPWLWDFLADTMSNTATFERKHQDLRGQRRQKGWLVYLRDFYWKKRT